MDRIVFKYILIISFVEPKSRGANFMDTFQYKELIFGPKTCICSFTLVENDGLVDVQTAKCNSKCCGKGKIRLGGPLPTTNLYNLDIIVFKGSVTVKKITASLATEVNITPKE